MGTADIPFNSSLFADQDERERTRNRSGLLPSQDIADLVSRGAIKARAPIAEQQIQPASLDLRLGASGFRVQSSFLPGESATVASKLEGLSLHPIDLSGPCVLERGCVYIVELMEQLELPKSLSAKANPKSTTGRLDVFARLVADYARAFDSVPSGHRGKLYVEIVPRTFSVVVRQGVKLNQLRFMRGTPASSDAHLAGLHKTESLVYMAGSAVVSPMIDDGLWISIDLEVSDVTEFVGYRAKRNAALIDFERVHHYEPSDFWEPIPRPRWKRLVLDPNEFYILASKERLRVPPMYAAEMVPYDPSAGEFRVHYAGFFDPGFGYGNNDIEGTRAVLEVRSHEVPFLLEDGQKVGRLVYERLLAEPTKIYGRTIGSSYQAQGLALSKQFRPESRRGYAAVEGLRELAGKDFVDLLGGVQRNPDSVNAESANGHSQREVDADALLPFVATNLVSRELDQRIAPLVAASLTPQRDLVFLNAQAARLRRRGIDTLDRLEMELEQRANDIVDFARVWLEGERQSVIARGVGVLFLYYVLVSAIGDRATLEATLTEDEFSYPHMRRDLAEQIIGAWSYVAEEKRRRANRQVQDGALTTE